MLKDEQLLEELGKLGIDGSNYRTLSLLPFVLVAWSDGKVQRAERTKIIDIAGAQGFLTGGGEDVLERWLAEQPSESYYQLGFKILIELARRERGIGADMNADTLADLINLCTDVAAVAGGLFGHAWSVSDAERDALDSIAESLSIDDGQSWKELLEDLGD